MFLVINIYFSPCVIIENEFVLDFGGIYLNLLLHVYKTLINVFERQIEGLKLNYHRFVQVVVWQILNILTSKFINQ